MTDTDSKRRRRPSRLGGWLQLVALTLTLLWAGTAWAQPSTNPEARMMAQTLFEEGRKLMDAGDHAEACTKFEESDRLDPAIGTQFHLADCYEHVGRLASAWILFVDVAAAAKARGQGDREAAARKRSSDLEPRLNRLIIDVKKPTAGLVVHRNATPVGAGQFGTAVPVDAGEHVIEASAPRREPFRKTVRIKGEGKTVRVLIPALRARATTPPPSPEPAPPAPKGKEKKRDDRHDAVTVRGAAALAMGVLGLVAVGIGAAAGIVAINKTSESEKFCPESDACFDRGLSLRQEARRAASASTVSFAVGASALVGGLILWLTIPDDPTDPAAAWGVTVGGRF